MSGPSNIEWTGQRHCSRCRTAKPMTDFNLDRSRLHARAYVCRVCKRKTPIGQLSWRDHSIARASGMAWCGKCKGFLPSGQIRKSGLCAEHQREADRLRYATDSTYRAERRQHAQARKRGVTPVPAEGARTLTDIFDGLCAYCDNDATTWDHVVPISKGGRTEPGNILPCCSSCNSSKGNRDLFPWLFKTGRVLKLDAADRLAHFQVIHD